MAITVTSAHNHVRNSLGGYMHLDMDIIAVCDNAGHFMTALYPWRHMERTSTAITLLEDGSQTVARSGEEAPYMVALLGYSPRGTDSRITAEDVAYLVTPEELEDMRHAVTMSTSATDRLNYFTVRYDDGTSPYVPEIVVDSFCDTTNEVDDLFLRYRKGWTPAVYSTAFELPVWMEPLYVACLRAFARGLEEEDAGSLNARLAEIRNGPLVAAAIERDVRQTTVKRHRIGPQQNWQVPGVHAAGQVRS